MNAHTYTHTQTATLPDFLFGRVTGEVRIVTDTGKQITCLKLDVDLGD